MYGVYRERTKYGRETAACNKILVGIEYTESLSVINFCSPTDSSIFGTRSKETLSFSHPTRTDVNGGERREMTIIINTMYKLID